MSLIKTFTLTVLLSYQILPETYKSALLDTLQSSACAGDLSTVDMEKYLKKTDVSVGSDASLANTTFNLTAWGDGINNSQIDNQVVQRLTISKAQEKEGDAAKANLAKASPSKASSAGAKGEPRRSSIPRPCSSSKVFAGAERSSTVKPKAEIVGACHKSSPSSERTFTVDVENTEKLQPQAASAKTSVEASQGSSIGCTDTSCLPRTPPVPRVEQLSGTCLNGSSEQPQQDKLSVSAEKKPTIRDAASEEKHVGVSKPMPNPTTGEWTGLLIRVLGTGTAVTAAVVHCSIRLGWFECGRQIFPLVYMSHWDANMLAFK